VVRIKAAGGALKRGPIDVPGVLRFAVVCDPHGAVFMVFKGMAPATAPVELGDDAIGNIGWRELHAGEWASDFAFYEKLFGWRKVQAIDMGALGTYQTFSGAAATPSSGAVDSATPAAAPQAIGGMMTKMADTPMPYWMYYINVDGIDAAADRVAKAGGQIMMAPHQVPTGQWIVVCTDPQGAWFSLLSSTK
jgi:predicted enzyme related to lactoylglutathione lyase